MTPKRRGGVATKRTSATSTHSAVAGPNPGNGPQPTLPKMNNVHYGPPKDSSRRKQLATGARVVDSQTWLQERRHLLAKEKDVTRAYDACVAARRDLPWEKVAKDYEFVDAVSGRHVTLFDLVRQQSHKPLILQHFMWPAGSDLPCSTCSLWFDSFHGVQTQLSQHANLVAVVQNPEGKESVLKKWVIDNRWTWPVLSSTGTSFNADFNVHQSQKDIAAKKDFLYNFKLAPNEWSITEYPGISVFALGGPDRDQVCRTYSCYARGLEPFCNFWSLLDLLPLGRNGSNMGVRKTDIKNMPPKVLSPSGRPSGRPKQNSIKPTA